MYSFLRRFWLPAFAAALMLGTAAPLCAQTPDQAAQIQNIKNDPAKLFAQAEGETADAALAAARARLIDAVRLKYRSIETAMESALPAAEAAAAQTAKFKVELRPSAIEWQIPGKKKKDPVTFSALVYADAKDARRYVMDRAMAVIRDPKKFKWGEGLAADAAKALSSSKENLIGQISQTIETGTVIATVETNGAVSESFQSRTRAFSKMTLNGVTSSSPVDLDGQQFVVSWISLEDLEKSFAPAKARVITAVQEAEKYETINNIQAALQNYYKAYLYADGYYGAIPYTFKGDAGETADLRAGAKARIEKILGTMTLETKPAYELAEEIILVPFEARYNGQRVSGVTFETRVGNTTLTDRLRGGRGRLELNAYEPAEKTESFDLKFGVDISEDLQRDEDLRNFEAARRPRMVRPVEADFSNIFKVNIAANFQGADVFFQVKTKNISALAGKWTFGDGEESTELNPKHTYNADGVFKVTVVLNGDTTLKDVKYVYLKDQLLRKTRLEEVAAVGTAMLLAPVETRVAPPVVVEAPPVTVKPDSAAAVPVAAPADTVAKTPPAPAPDPVKETPKEAPKVRSESEIMADKKVAAKSKDVFEEIRYIEVTSRLLAVLDRKMKANEFIVAYKQSELADSDGAMVIIADKKVVYDKLVFSGNRYMSLKSGEEIEDLKTRYAGKAMIWVQAAVKEGL